MKFLQDVYFSIEYVCPEFQYWHALFVHILKPLRLEVGYSV